MNNEPSSFTTQYSPEEALKRAKHSGIILSVILCTLSLWVICVAMWQFFGEPFPVLILSKLIIVYTLIPGVCLARMAKFTPEQMGLGLKEHSRAIKNGLVITAVLLVSLPLFKLFLIKIGIHYFDGEKAFIDWGKYPFTEYVSYVFSVIIQNIAARSLLQNLIAYSLPVKHSEGFAVAIASLMFAAMHTHLGFVYMIGSGFMFAVFGLIYKHDKTIWGLCIPHYVLGMFAGLLNFID